jgi:Rrf2 family transcriptional regulator, cysteine metabolism repressor
MKISYKGDYALKAILDLSFFYQSGGVVALTEISRRNDIPLKFLEQIMLVLKGAGYVDSKRGLGGGFYLKKPPSEITLADIIRLIEGAVEPIACVNKSAEPCCAEIDSCAFREVWVKVTDEINKIVENVTFADLMRRQNELKKRNSGYMYQI